MPRGKLNLKSARVTAKAARVNVGKTRKQARYIHKMDRKMRILQGAIAGQVAADAAGEMQVAGVLNAPAAGADLLDAPVNIEQAVAVMNTAALQADRPNVLLRRIAYLRERASRIKARYLTVRHVVNAFVAIAMAYYAQFPLHAAPRELSFLDIAAGHISIAGTASGFLGMSVAEPLGSIAFGVKSVGKTIRNYNARTGRFPNTPANELRRELNLAEYHPSIGTGMIFVKLAAAAPGVAFNAATGARGKNLVTKAVGRVMKTAAATAKDLGELTGVSEEAALGKMKAAGTSVGALL